MYTSPSFTPSTAGTYRWIASYSGDGTNLSTAGSCNDANEQSTVSRIPVSLTTDAGSARIGGQIEDTATLSGTRSGTGTITFKLYGANDQTCSAAPVATFIVNVNGDGDYNSPGYSPSSLGTYQWIASYSGDTNNGSATGSCGDPTEQSTVMKNLVRLVTGATPSARTGGSISDAATLSAGYNPTGTITWKLYGPGDAHCSAAPIQTFTQSVNGNGTYTSPGFTPTSAGTYRWIASYSGDGANFDTSGSCNDPDEQSSVTP
jgi:hypothetical protein